MQIIANDNNCFTLKDEKGNIEGVLAYEDKQLLRGEIRTDRVWRLENTAIGLWTSFLNTKNKVTRLATIKVAPGGVISLQFSIRKSKYRFRKTGSWKLRFVLLNKDGDELLALLPGINWQKKTYEFTLQVNDEYKEECTPVLILHTVHCAICSLSMINGGSVPALISL